jgi:hypothetical protein
MNNIDIELYEFLDLINETLSQSFLERWKYKYSEKFIRNFQNRLFKAFKDQKPMKLDTLRNFLMKKCGYSPLIVEDFFEDIEIEIFYPLIRITRKRKGR